MLPDVTYTHPVLLLFPHEICIYTRIAHPTSSPAPVHSVPKHATQLSNSSSGCTVPVRSAGGDGTEDHVCQPAPAEACEEVDSCSSFWSFLPCDRSQNDVLSEGGNTTCLELLVFPDRPHLIHSLFILHPLLLNCANLFRFLGHSNLLSLPRLLFSLLNSPLFLPQPPLFPQE